MLLCEPDWHRRLHSVRGDGVRVRGTHWSSPSTPPVPLQTVPVSAFLRSPAAVRPRRLHTALRRSYVLLVCRVASKLTSVRDRCVRGSLVQNDGRRSPWLRSPRSSERPVCAFSQQSVPWQKGGRRRALECTWACGGAGHLRAGHPEPLASLEWRLLLGQPFVSVRSRLFSFSVLMAPIS